ncbi:MAG: winged helix-turn-helix domain-containing protein [Nanoarchaeota archaeon]
MAKRSKIDIIIDILNCINEKGKIKPTHLMYKSNLSHIQMKGYLSKLTEKGMIEEYSDKDKKLIGLTKRGASFLNEISRMKEFQETFGL